MRHVFFKWIPALLAAGIILLYRPDFLQPPGTPDPGQPVPRAAAVAVEVAPVRKGPILRLRTFSGTLASTSQCLVAPKVAGRVESLTVGLSDRVERGQVVARLDNAEYVQAVAQCEADMAVALAERTEAKSSLEIAGRDLSRMLTLKKKGVSSAAQVDGARAVHLTAKAALEIAGAKVLRAGAVLESARIRLGYTTVTAEWEGGDHTRFVGEKRVSPGEMVGAHTPLLNLVELDPLTAVFFVAEKDYTRLAKGQTAFLSTDAWPEEEFAGNIFRISPVFDRTTRQARVELKVDNPGYRLKPGMFVRITLVLDRVEHAVIVPETALAGRSDRTGVFRVDPSGDTVSWQTVKTGIRHNGFVQIKGGGCRAGW